MNKVGRNYFVIVANAYVPTNTGGVIDLSPKYSFLATELRGGILITPNVGVAGFLTITLAGTYAVGDEIRITITSNTNSKQLFTKTYFHTVQAGATTVTAIATALASRIRNSFNTENPIATVTNALGVITITQKGDDKFGLIGYVNTNSASGGTIVLTPTPTVLSEGQPSDLLDRGADPSDVTLAAYDTVRIGLVSEAAIPFIDSVGGTAKEIYWYGAVGNGAGLVALL